MAKRLATLSPYKWLRFKYSQNQSIFQTLGWIFCNIGRSYSRKCHTWLFLRDVTSWALLFYSDRTEYVTLQCSARTITSKLMLFLILSISQFLLIVSYSATICFQNQSFFQILHWIFCNTGRVSYSRKRRTLLLRSVTSWVFLFESERTASLCSVPSEVQLVSWCPF